jgi:hypothetical protein
MPVYPDQNCVIEAQRQSLPLVMICPAFPPVPLPNAPTGDMLAAALDTSESRCSLFKRLEIVHTATVTATKMKGMAQVPK